MSIVRRIDITIALLDPQEVSWLYSELERYWTRTLLMSTFLVHVPTSMSAGLRRSTDILFNCHVRTFVFSELFITYM